MMEVCEKPTQDFDYTRHLPEKHDFFCLLTGRRASGKTVLAMELLHKLHESKRFFRTILVSGSLKFQDPKEYFPSIKKKYRHPGEDLNLVVGNLMNIQAEQMERNRKECKHILIVLDDVQGVSGLKYNRLIEHLAVQGRHRRISVIAIAQHLVSAFNTTTRNNSDMICCFPSSSQQVLQFLVQSFGFFGKAVSQATKRESYDFINRLWARDEYTCIWFLPWLIGKSHCMQDFIVPHKASTDIPEFDSNI